MEYDLYSNLGHSSRSRGGTWVYINGELYHAGVKGMHWYQHLPWVDWYKTASSRYKQYSTPTPQSTSYIRKNGKAVAVTTPASNPSKVKAFGRAIKDTASEMRSVYGDYLKGEKEYYSKKASDSANAKYAGNKHIYDTYIGSRPVSHLEKLMGKMLDSGENFVNKSGIMNTINLAIRNAGYDVLKGINGFLRRKGWDDEVDNFLSKKVLHKASGKFRQNAIDRKYTEPWGSSGKLKTKNPPREMARTSSGNFQKQEQLEIRRRNKNNKNVSYKRSSLV